MEAHDHDSDECSPRAPVVYTVGHGNRSAAELMEMLSASAIDGIADVRAYPISRRHPQFSQKSLVSSLDRVDIAYWWLGGTLGGFRRTSSSSIHTALNGDSLRAYAEHMDSAAFQKGIAELLRYASQRTIAMLCAERLPEHCHRALISDFLTINGISVIHILGGDRSMPHQVSRLARREQGRLVYDRGCKQLGWEF